jgi:hypothetical protein
MVRIVRATTYQRRADSGRSEPPMCLAEDGGETFEVFLKVPGLHGELTAESLVCELMAGQLAQDLGLPCPTPMIVELSPEFVDSLTVAPELQVTFRNAPQFAFGSENLGSQWRAWSRGSSTPRVALPTVTDIYVFDTLIENSDRGNGNPNLLKKGDQLAILDHEEAFSNGRKSAAKRSSSRMPWQSGGIVNHYAGNLQHVLWPRLKPARSVDFGAALAKWESLPPNAFLGYAALVPNDWSSVCARNVADYLSDACRNLAAFQVQLERVFAGR